MEFKQETHTLCPDGALLWHSFCFYFLPCILPLRLVLAFMLAVMHGDQTE